VSKSKGGGKIKRDGGEKGEGAMQVLVIQKRLRWRVRSGAGDKSKQEKVNLLRSWGGKERSPRCEKFQGQRRRYAESARRIVNGE